MDNNLSYTLSLKDFFKKTMISAQQQTAKLDSGMDRLNSTLNQVGGIMAGVFAFSKIKDFVSGVVVATAAMQGFNNAIMASSRTQGEGLANISFLNKQVDKLGLNLKAAQAGYKTFTGSVIGTNIQGAKANRVFRQVSEASAVLGLSAEQTEGSFLALGQMISKGTVQAEELRGQLAERIPGAFNIGARAMKMSTADLGNAMKNGLIKADDFLVKFGDELEKTFGPKLENATNSLQSNLNRMSTEWEKFKVNIGNSNEGLIAGMTGWVSWFIKDLNYSLSTLNKLENGFKSASVAQFTWLEKSDNFMSNLFSNVGLGWKTTMQYYASLQNSMQSMYVNPSTRSKKDALGSEADLLRLMSSYGKSFANKDINKYEYDKSMALFNAALGEIRGNKTLNDNGGKKDKGAAGQSQIGSPVEVSGARPQNITINIDSLIKTLTLQSQTVEGGAGDIKRILSKHLLEVLNDANESVKK